MSIATSLKRWQNIITGLKANVRRLDLIEQNLEHLLNRQYDHLRPDQDYKAFMRSREFKVHSQNGEDGLLLYIFSQIGTTNRTFIEFGITDGRECCTANLSLNFGWNGLLLDGSEENVQKARAYYGSDERVMPGALKVEHAFITRENVNEVFSKHGVTGEIDLLSIDIDGNDLWVWEAIEVVQPRVVVIEYNDSVGPNRALSVKYDPAFERFAKHQSGWYHGASVAAFANLGEKKGYKLICCDSEGTNALFVLKSALQGTLRGISAAEAFYPRKKRLKILPLEEQFNVIKDLEWVEVR